MLADVDTDKPRDIRDRAILLLLAIYGMRSGEVAALRLDQIDWSGRTLRLFRLKRRQPQTYPLVQSVAEGLARYIDTVRPASSCPEVFLCMHAPRRPMKAGSIYNVANRRFTALGLEAAHQGGHALRHACATRLLADAVLVRKHSPASARPRIFDGVAEAKLIALACSKPPKGRKRWTLQLLEEQVVELKIVDRASDNTIGRTLKKTFSGRICRSNGSSHRMPMPRS